MRKLTGEFVNICWKKVFRKLQDSRVGKKKQARLSSFVSKFIIVIN